MWINCQLRSSICGNPCYFWPGAPVYFLWSGRAGAQRLIRWGRAAMVAQGPVRRRCPEGGGEVGDGRCRPETGGPDIGARGAHRGGSPVPPRVREGLAQLATKRRGRLNRPRSRQSECAAQPGGLPNKSGPAAQRAAKQERPRSPKGCQTRAARTPRRRDAARPLRSARDRSMSLLHSPADFWSGRRRCRSKRP